MPAEHSQGVRNPVRDIIRAGEVAFGLNVRLSRSSEIARVARTTGYSFLYIDAQHAPYNVETMAQLAGFALGCGVAPMVRVRSAEDPNIPILLDAGVLGIVVPDTESAAQAERVVRVSKFAPVGNRSLAGMDIHHNFAPIPPERLMPMLNDAVLVICMIESEAGMANLEEIAAVPGLDGLYLGGNDLLASMGLPGRYDDPAVYRALDRVVETAAAHGLFAGCGGLMGVQRQAEVIRRGVRFLTPQSDLGLVLSGARETLQRLRDAIGDLS
jgi:2-keto-3-deoxy-L-rhamnonate aldolase RhmA